MMPVLVQADCSLWASYERPARLSGRSFSLLHGGSGCSSGILLVLRVLFERASVSSQLFGINLDVFWNRREATPEVFCKIFY